MNSKRREELIIQLGDIVGELGWNIVIPMEKDAQEINGLVIGTNEFLDQVLYRFTVNGDKVIYPESMTAPTEEDTVKITPKKDDDNSGGPTFH